MKPPPALISLALLVGFSGVAHSQNGCARLSWGTCDPFIQNKSLFSDEYRLVESMYGVSTPNIGTDTQIRIDFGDVANGQVPDAWRFDDAGCQTGQLSATNQALNQACPSMGSNATTIVQYLIDAQYDAVLHLTATYDEFTPVASTRYTVWQVVFDHSYSTFGPTDPQYGCGGGERGANFIFDFVQVIPSTGARLNLSECDVNQYFYCGHVTWEGGAVYPEAGGGCGALPTQPMTWGRVKSTYR